MLCAAKEEISILPVIGESVLPLAADLFAADPAFVETRIPKKIAVRRKLASGVWKHKSGLASQPNCC
jgi:hypothetical protein